MTDLEISYTDSDDVSTDAPSKFLTRALAAHGITYVAPPKAVTTSEDWSNPVQNTSALALIAEEQGLLATVGLATDRKDLFFDEGTAFLAIGHANALAERARLDTLPDFEEGINAFKAEIASENRRDHIVDLTEYRINASGNLDKSVKATGDSGAMLSEVAWRQLAATVKSQNINKGLSGRTRMVRRVRARDLPGK